MSDLNATQSALDEKRPLYCVDDEVLDALGPNDPCPRCGASENNLGACGAVYPRPEPRPLLEIVYEYKPTGEIIR